MEVIPARSDNYIFLVTCPSSGESVVVDPCSADAVSSKLNDQNQLVAIWNTHHHHDHVGGNRALKAQTACKIIGSKADRSRIPGIDIEVEGGVSFKFAGREVQVIDTPGHTNGAISFWLKEDELLFCGDTLFSLGCGRLFEGTAKEMWESLERIMKLPSSTKVYCAHEYTEANGAFAIKVEPNNGALIARLQEVKELRRYGKSSIPTTLKMELATNPFLRTDSMEIRKNLGLENSKNWEVFAAIRSLKDKF